MNKICIVLVVMVMLIVGSVQGMTVQSEADTQQEEVVISGGQEYMTRRDVTLEIICASIGLAIAWGLYY